MSMISRQKLIDKLNSYHYTIIGMRCGKKVTAEIIKEYHDHVIEVIESQPPADHWISCSERPPEEPCFYTVEDRSPYTLKRHGKPRRKVVTVKPYMWDVYDHVVAWKPIDMEPYKGE